jgi:PAS domain S-box-containing protein
MAVRVAIVILASTGIAYFHVFSLLESQTRGQLEKFVIERGQRENSLFSLAQDHMTALKEELLWQFKQATNKDPSAEFNQLFVKQKDGVTRNRPETFNYKRQAGLFIDPRITINADVRRRVMIFYKMANDYGPAWKNRFAGTYFLTPENFSVSFWPTVPIAQQQPADFYEPDQEYFFVADRQHNPQRKTVWTGVYFDPLVKHWMVSCVSPFYIGERHITTVGHDVLLDELLKRTVNDQLKGTYNIIFRKDGRLIAHPQLMKEIEQQQGKFNILKLGDDHLKNIFQRVKNMKPGEVVIDNANHDEYLAVTTITGPDWYFVTVFPKSILSEQAFKTARFILLLGLVSLLVEVGVLYWVLRQQVAIPLQKFTMATEGIAGGNLDIQMDATRKDELGTLASSFNLMARAVAQRDAQLASQNAQLEKEIEARTAELTQTIKRLSAEITERQKVEEALRGSEEQFRSLSACSPVGIFLTDTEGRCTYTNPRCQAIAGFTFEEALGEGWAQSVYPGDRDRVFSYWSAYTHAQGAQKYSDEYRFLLPEGIMRWVNVRSSPMFCDKGKLLGYVGTVEDITERKQAEDDIRKALETERELGNLKSRFITMASHEFRTPLATISLCSELLKTYGHKFSDEKKLKQINQIQAAVQRMTHLLNDVLFIGKSEAGRIEFSPIELNLEAFCQELLEEMKMIFGNNYTFEFHFQGKESRVQMDENLLRQMLTNLLSNAVKYSPLGGTIKFNLICENGQAIFKVRDEGIGIPAADQPRLFEAFHRASNVGNISGTGLGTVIIKQAVDLHGGSITFESEVGVGTTFTVELPMTQHPKINI